MRSLFETYLRYQIETSFMEQVLVPRQLMLVLAKSSYNMYFNRVAPEGTRATDVKFFLEIFNLVTTNFLFQIRDSPG